jgi:hypothetical protein
MLLSELVSHRHHENTELLHDALLIHDLSGPVIAALACVRLPCPVAERAWAVAGTKSAVSILAIKDEDHQQSSPINVVHSMQ